MFFFILIDVKHCSISSSTFSFKHAYERILLLHMLCVRICGVWKEKELKKVKYIDLTLSILAVLVGRHVVHSVALRTVGGGTVGLGAGQRGQS